MCLFFTDDYPDWVGELFAEFCEPWDVTDQIIWELVRESKEMPHIGNVVAGELLENVANAVRRISGGENVEIECDINAMGTRIYIDGDSYTDKDSIMEYLESKEKE